MVGSVQRSIQARADNANISFGSPIAVLRVRRKYPDCESTAEGMGLLRNLLLSAQTGKDVEGCPAVCCAFAGKAVRLQLDALACNFADFMRALVLPEAVQHWSLTSLRDKLVKIGAEIITHARHLPIRMAAVAVAREVFHEIVQPI